MLSSSDGAIIYATPVTLSDTDVLSSVTRGLYIGSAGNLNVQFGIKQNGEYANALFMGVRAGSVLPIRVNKVFNTGTSAGNILALY